MSQPNAKNAVKLEIERLSYGPYGIGRVDGKVVIEGTMTFALGPRQDAASQTSS